jgi:hypothetical protein
VPAPNKRYTPPKAVLVLTEELDDDASLLEKERAARRRLVATTGRCPCGAQFRLPDDLKAGTVTIVAVEHEDDCPAAEEATTT